jgi:hypothetical protein
MEYAGGEIHGLYSTVVVLGSLRGVCWRLSNIE